MGTGTHDASEGTHGGRPRDEVPAVMATEALAERAAGGAA